MFWKHWEHHNYCIEYPAQIGYLLLILEPIKEELEGFWQMVWQEGSSVIVTIDTINEINKVNTHNISIKLTMMMTFNE